ncbi:MAG: M23 family metallopeptidase [Bacillota bacterium]|nr:MAG: hypothetical protein DIU66_01785 [Bacillota bacterium]
MWGQRESDPYAQYYSSSDGGSINRFLDLQKVLIALSIFFIMLFFRKVDLPQTSAIVTRIHRAITYEMDLASILEGLKSQKFIKAVPTLKDVLNEKRGDPSLISKQFIAPLTGKVTKADQRHGIDIEQIEGTPVKAAAAGTVIQVAEDAELGRMIKIRHEGDVVTVYARLGEVYVKLGDNISQGQIIGTVGEKGLAENPGLYFEIWEKGVAQDPERWLDFEEKI